MGKALQQQLRSLAHGLAFDPVEQTVTLAFLSEKDILKPGEIPDQFGMLLDRSDAAVDGVPGGLNALRFTVEPDLAFVGRIEAGDDLHECGLPSTVDAQERVNLSGRHGEVHAVESHDRPEPLRYSRHAKDV